MDTVTVTTKDLLVALNANRAAHAGIVQEALDGYQAECVRLLEQHLAAVRAGKVRQIAVNLPVPVDRTKDYDRIIRMAEMSVQAEVELTQAEFAQYVMDDWNWKQQFLTSNAAYSQTAGAALQ